MQQSFNLHPYPPVDELSICTDNTSLIQKYGVLSSNNSSFFVLALGFGFDKNQFHLYGINIDDNKQCFYANTHWFSAFCIGNENLYLFDQSNSTLKKYSIIRDNANATLTLDTQRNFENLFHFDGYLNIALFGKYLWLFFCTSQLFVKVDPDCLAVISNFNIQTMGNINIHPWLTKCIHTEKHYLCVNASDEKETYTILCVDTDGNWCHERLGHTENPISERVELCLHGKTDKYKLDCGFNFFIRDNN